jgi:hypothetical protein
MSNLPSPLIERARVKLERTNTGWATAALPQLGRSGRILSVRVREDATSAAGTAGYLVLARGAPSDSTDDLDVFYRSGAFALAGSATTASFGDALVPPAPYRVPDLGDLQVGVNLTAGGTGATLLWIDILAEVWG